MGTTLHYTEWPIVAEEVTVGTPVVSGWIAAGDTQKWAFWYEGSGAATISLKARFSPVQPNDRKRDADDSYLAIEVTAAAAIAGAWYPMPTGFPESFGQMQLEVSTSATTTATVAVCRLTQ